MSLFDFNESDRQDYENWMQGVKGKIRENVNEKSRVYCFNFEVDKRTRQGKFSWEDINETEKRLSTMSCKRSSLSFRRSSLSTLVTLGEDELEDDIPQISIPDLEIRISQELESSPFVLLPHKR